MFKKILYPALFILSIWFFFRGIPLDTLHGHSALLGCIGAIIAMVLAFMALLQFFPINNTKEQTEESKSGSSFGCLVVVGVMGFFILYAAAFILDVTGRTKKELEQNGAIAMGEVVDGSSIKTRRADFTSLTIKYIAEDGKEYNAELDISASEFSQYYKYQELPILYSKKYPYIIQVVKDEAVLRKYYVQSMPELSLNDLLKIFKIKTSEATLVYLNVINKQWVNGDVPKLDSMIYVNYLKHIAIKTIGKNKLQYIHHSMDTALYNKQLQEFGFVAVTGNNKEGSSYKNKDFLVSIRNETMQEVAASEASSNAKQLTIVGIEKLDNPSKPK